MKTNYKYLSFIAVLLFFGCGNNVRDNGDSSSETSNNITIPSWLANSRLDSSCVVYFEPITEDGFTIFNSNASLSVDFAEKKEVLDRRYIGIPFRCMVKEIQNGNERAEELLLNYIVKEFEYINDTPGKYDQCGYLNHFHHMRSPESYEFLLKLSLSSSYKNDMDGCKYELIKMARSYLTMRIKSISGKKCFDYLFGRDPSADHYDRYDEFMGKPKLNEELLWSEVLHPVIYDKFHAGEIILSEYGEEMIGPSGF